MKCLTCFNFSFYLICKKCQQLFLTPNIKKKIVKNDIIVYSFYRYSDIENLLKSKYTVYGSTIYKILAKNSFEIFAKEFNFNSKIFAIPIDDNVNRNFSHSAILTKSLKSNYIIPLYGKLRATNRVQYAGKSKSFREKNPRAFKYSAKEGINIILVDDIITYGVTLNEAIDTLKKHNVNILFALTLANTID